MAEESNKGIALVILGIVAVIAIVGLVLLFTGAKKSTGEFMVAQSKVYGGAIQGVGTPYDRAFTGQSYASGQNSQYYAARVANAGSATQFGSDAMQSTVQNEAYANYNRDIGQISSYQTACEKLSVLAGLGSKYGTEASYQKAESYKSMGRTCKSTTELLSVVYKVNTDQYSLARSLVGNYDSIGVNECCENAGLV